MNEPHDLGSLGTSGWRTISQDAINAIRAEGANNLILVSGNHWTGAHSWTSSEYERTFVTTC